nr:Sulx [Starmerella bombicola]
MSESRVPSHREVRSFVLSDDEISARPASLIVDTPTRLKPLTSQWYLAYYIPALEWIPNYSWSALPGDLCSGITLASFQIPISLSYATSLASIDAVSGLFGLIVAPLIYALLGSVPVMVVAPEGPISLMIGKLVPPYFTDPPEHRHGRSYLDAEQVCSMIAGSAGALILLLGLLRVGFLTNILAQSLLRGFITGVGIVMIADQIPAMLGMTSAMHDELGLDASSFEKAIYTWNHWREAQPLASKFSLSALLAIVIFKLAKKYYLRKGYKRAVLFPDILLVVIVSTILSKWGKLVDHGLSVVGDVSSDGLELIWMLRPKYFSDFKINFYSSFFVGVLGLMESTVAARLLGGSSEESHQEDEPGLRSANRELVALGAANVIGSMFGSLPSYGGYGRSKINMLSGGTTQMSGIVSALLTLLCTRYLMSLVYHLPRCTLSAIIASIGISILEEAPPEIMFFWRVRSYTDLLTMAISLLFTFFWSVEAGVTIGAATALVRVIHHACRPRIQMLVRDPRSTHFVNADENNNFSLSAEQSRTDGVLVVKIPEPLTFANSSILEQRLRRLELHGTNRVHPGQPRARQRRLETVVFHLKGMTSCDATAAATLCGITRGYLKRGIRVIFTEVVTHSDVNEMLERSDIVQMLESQPYPSSFFNSVTEAIDSLS